MAGIFRGSFSRLFLTFVVIPLLFIAGVQLFVLSAQTATYFAWTINPPLTAAFLGAGYWAALCAAYLGLRQADWAMSSTSIPGSFMATTLLGIATFLHLDKFHLASPVFITRFVTWVWIAVYVVTPPLFLVLLIRQFASGKRAPTERGQQTLLQSGLLILGVIYFLTGAVLFVTPATLIPLWPWTLTPLAARAVGAWLAAFGGAAAAVYFARGRQDSRGTLGSLLAFCLLQLVVVFRYSATMDWGRPLAWFFIVLLVAGAGLSFAALRARTAEPSTA